MKRIEKGGCFNVIVWERPAILMAARKIIRVGQMEKPLPRVVSGRWILKVTGCRTRPKANQRNIFMRITTWSKSSFCVSTMHPSEHLNILLENQNKYKKIQVTPRELSLAKTLKFSFTVTMRKIWVGTHIFNLKVHPHLDVVIFTSWKKVKMVDSVNNYIL